ncbi:MAG TPA: glycosyltransferase family 2 protein, partial [Solirubrobacteraceae bacterium]|nr:glycosyltransferase family 2 protein [Solirubrobacteraceae bacterium]
MDGPTPALAAARCAVAATGAESILPVAGQIPAAIDRAVLMVEEPPSAELLDALRLALERAAAVVIWAAGWSEETAIEALGAHGFDSGSVDFPGAPEPGMLAVLVREAATARRLSATQQRLRRPFRALAIMPAFNEADVIYHAIGALVAGGVDVYLIDHESTDGTAAAASPWLGRGLVAIERFPEDAGYDERNRGSMVWREILRRVQEVSGEQVADWYLFVNADEFREAPWPATTLAEGLREVDDLGYSAINFELLNFRPIDDSYVPGEDPRVRLRHYEAPGRHDLLQVKAWKRQAAAVDLVHHGGHDVLFEGKRVFPVPFILRHYPIRSSEHGRRKVIAERLSRFAVEERAGGWHVQYDQYADGSDYLHDAAELTEWDPERVRLELLAACLRRTILAQSLAGNDPATVEPDGARLATWLERR